MNHATRYMGLDLASPLVVSACTLSEDVDNIVRMEQAGAGAVVLYSLFEEQIREEDRLYEAVLDASDLTSVDAPAAIQNIESFHAPSGDYVRVIREAKQRVSMPVIASLNGVSPEGWMAHAHQIQDAGADALELNVFYVPADPQTSSIEVEQRYLRIVQLIRKTVSIPVAIKLSPYFSAMGHIAQRIADIGADGLVLFNRFYEPDMDIENLTMVSELSGSRADEIRLPLLWIGALHGRIDASLAATTGVQDATEVIKYLLAGADVVMTASALYRNGIEHIATMLADLDAWMARKGYDSVEDFRGLMSQRNVSDTTAYERANYLRVLHRD